MKTFHVMTASFALALAALFAGQAAAADRAGSTSVYRAGHLKQVRLIHLDSNLCTLGIKDELKGEGFLVTDKTAVADAVLEVKIETNDSLQDHGKVEKARYSATLLGANNSVLFASGGNERGRNLEELCEDIGDHLADDIENRKDDT